MGYVETHTPWCLRCTLPHTTALPLSYTLPSPGFAMRPTSLFCHLWPSFVLLPGPPVRIVEGAAVVPRGHLSMSMLLLLSMSPIFIFGPTLNLFKESTDMCSVVTNPIIWNLGPQFGHIMLPKRWEGSKLWRALLSKGLTTSAQKSLTAGAHLSPIPCIIAVGDILQGTSIL